MSEKRFPDTSLLLKRATDLLLMENPLGTTIGILLGAVSYGAAQVLGAAVNIARTIANAVGLWFWEALCITPFAIATYSRRTPIPPNIEATLAEIRASRRRGDITDAQARMLSVSLLTKLVETSLASTTLTSQGVALSSEKLLQGMKKDDYH